MVDPVIETNIFSEFIGLDTPNVNGDNEEVLKSDSLELELPFGLDLKEAEYDVVEPIELNSPEKLTPVQKQLVMSENYFSPPRRDTPTRASTLTRELFSNNLESYDIIERTIPASDRHISRTSLSDSEDIANPLYTEKLSRIINMRPRSYAHTASTLDKKLESIPKIGNLDSSEFAPLTSSITMEEELQPHSVLPSSGNHWSAFRLPFTQPTVSLSVSDHAIWIVEGGKGQIYWCKSKKSQMSWSYLPGIQAKQVATSYNGLVVLAVNKDNQLFQRKGVSQSNLAGKMWDRIHDGRSTGSIKPYIIARVIYSVTFTQE